MALPPSLPPKKGGEREKEGGWLIGLEAVE